MIPYEEAAKQIASVARDIVQYERERQIKKKGYTFEHDDEHGDESLATAAAFYILPAGLNPDVAFNEGSGIGVMPLQEFIAQSTFRVFREDDAFFADDELALDERVEVLTKGLALGLAELERLLRIREARS